MPKTFVINPEDFLKPIVDELRDLSNSISDWHPSDIQRIQADASKTYQIVNKINGIAKMLRWLFHQEKMTNNNCLIERKKWEQVVNLLPF